MIQTFYNVVDEAIASLGLNVEETKGDQPGQWNLKKGKFDIMVDVWEQEKQFLFQVICPLCTLPDDNKEGFMLHLLQKNYGLSSLAYAIMEDSVYLKYTTEMNLLTTENIVTLLTKTAFYAEQSAFVPN
ncbi:MAG: YbjN domain-containing protein [Bacteroidia bacterium]|nr:YbjN domain-containing protein [Bacteroidia bacterium]